MLVSDLLRKGLNIDVSVLMGANVAKEVSVARLPSDHVPALTPHAICSQVARDEFSEATIGGVVDANTAVWKSLFDRPTFRITTVRDAAGEWCSGGDVAASRHQCPPLRQPWNCAVR